MEIHPSQRRFACESCRKNKAKCQRTHPDDPKCVRCTVADRLCDSGQQRRPGRPKRKELASSSAVENPPVTKRQRQTARANPPSTVSNDLRLGETLSTQTRPAAFDIHEAVTGTDPGEDRVPRRHPGVQAVPSTSTLLKSIPEWLQQSSSAAGPWSHWTLPLAVSDTASTNLAFDGPHQPMAPPLPSTSNRAAMDSAIFPSPLSRPNPGSQSDTSMPSNSRVGKRKDPLPFGIGRQPAYYVHENKFSSDPAKVVLSDVGADGSNAMPGLKSIVYGLRLRSTILQTHRSKIDLHLLIHRNGPLFIASYSLAEYIMTSTQELVQITAILLRNPAIVQKHNDESSAALISTITDIYTRLLAFFELFLEHLTLRAERTRTDPVIPIRGLRYNNTLITGPCTQGTLFTSTVYHLLCKLEVTLGLYNTSEVGLLSKAQINVLWNKLDGSNDLNDSKGIMRPVDMRNLYGQLSMVLEQIAANE